MVGLLGYIARTTLMAQSRARRAREVTIPEITRLVGIDEYAKAYDLAQQANRDIPNDPMLASLMAQMTALPTFTVTRPAAVRVSVKPYAAPAGGMASGRGNDAGEGAAAQRRVSLAARG